LPVPSLALTNLAPLAVRVVELAMFAAEFPGD
jgi:hypothetical protein